MILVYRRFLLISGVLSSSRKVRQIRDPAQSCSSKVLTRVAPPMRAGFLWVLDLCDELEDLG